MTRYASGCGTARVKAGSVIPSVEQVVVEAIRRASKANQLPVDRITEVRMLDPYFYR